MNNPDDTSPLDVIHNPAMNRFEIQLEDSVAFLDYQIHNDDMIFLHTETPPQHEGIGIGSRLVCAGLDYAKDHL